MKKILSIFLLVFVASSLFAQRDTKHWFAPMMDEASSSGSQALYFSTDSTTPFNVDIYNNNVVIGTVTISKNNPAIYNITNRSLIITTNSSDTFSVKTMGLYTEGSKPYFVQLRFSVLSHGEILTGKGQAGIGTEFYSINAPITNPSSSLNFTTGILATEDNTQVTVTDYGNVQFYNGTSGNTNPTLNFTLDKGESYIIAGRGDQSGNQTGFIGAKITATKPVNVTNGNMNGQFAIATSFGGSDIVMDQSVPTEFLGDEFVIVKGNGDIGRGTEGALIVAVEDNTEIFINNGATAVATIDEGEFYRINDNMWVNNGTGGVNHYNMYISTSKDAYVYQLLNGNATGNYQLGFNYIPPLSCYLPKKIDEIGKIDELPGYDPIVKLNILTEAGATVTVTSSTGAVNLQGPFQVTGTNNWESYQVLDITGNVTIESTAALTAGISAEDNAVGYGGYFAGFSTTPFIEKSGDCIPGTVLEVNDDYETYQWFHNGNPIPGANTNTYTPVLPGEYTLTVDISGCLPITTTVFKVFNCATETTQDVYVCNSRTFTPEFTVSPQTIDLSSIQITSPPTNGTVTIDPATGEILYVPNTNYTGLDEFTYQFSGNIGEFADVEIVTVEIEVVELQTYDATIAGCQYEGVGIFNLTAADVTTFTNVTYQYFASQTDLLNETNEIQNPTAYEATEGVVYVLVTTPEGCVDSAEITLQFYDLPVVFDGELTVCYLLQELNTTGVVGVFDLSIANVTNASPVTKEYYESLGDAENGNNPIVNFNTYISPSKDVYVKVIDNRGCYSIAKITLNVIPPKFSPSLTDQYICIEDRVTLDAGPGYDLYSWSTGESSQSITVGVGEYEVTLTSNGCETIQTVRVIKSTEPVITKIDIENDNVTLTVAGGTPPYEYSMDGVNWQTSNVFQDLDRGENGFYVRDAYNCTPIYSEVTVPNVINAITPNGDGNNDVIDYSALAYKGNLSMSIYDRYGNLVHVADKNNGYKWDGKINNREVHTGTYWYHLTWNEPDSTQTQVKYSGWILVKNRD